MSNNLINEIPSVEEIQKKLLEILQDGEVHTRRDLIDHVIKKYNLTDEHVNLKLSSGERIIDNRVGYAKSYLHKEGKIEYLKRGECRIKVITNSNLNTPLNNTQITTQVSPEEQIEKSAKDLERDLKESLLDKVRSMDPYKFEQLVVDLLVKMGYAYDKTSAWKTQNTNDEGIDGVVVSDPLGFDRIYIQAKRYKKGNNVDRPELQNFNGTKAKNKKGIFITTSDFKPTALDFYKDEALEKDGIILVNGDQLANLMFKYNLGVYEHQSYSIKKIDNDYFEELED